MEKKFKLSDKNTVSKIVYLTAIAILCISALIIGIVAANSRKKSTPSEDPGTSDATPAPTPDTNEGTTDNSGSGDSTNKDDKVPVPLFVSPAVGTVYKSHSTTVPVFSNTLDEWRIHTGIDISVEDGAPVYAAADGEVTAVYNDAMLGQTVEITHSDTHKSYYSNLNKENLVCSVGDKVFAGDTIGYVGDSAIIEIADEPHLHFEMKVSDVSVNPLDYISDESKLASLGIVSGSDV